MRELELAGLPSIDASRALGPAARAPFPLSRMALAASVVVHVVAGYALIRQEWPAAVPPPPSPLAEFFLFEMPRPAPIVEPAPPPAVEPQPETREQPEAEPPAPVRPTQERRAAPAPRAAEPVEPQAPPAEAPTTPVVPVPSGAELLEARERAADQVVTERAARDARESEYLTFSLDDVAPPRPEPEPDQPSIFDGGFAGPSRGPNVGQLGQTKTKFGARMASLCNALTGGFSLMGWGSFCAGPADGGPTGLFPEVRPEYLDLMPECVDTRDTAPALALEAPFSTVKCRLVKQVEPPDEP
jgi:hypothetical protein